MTTTNSPSDIALNRTLLPNKSTAPRYVIERAGQPWYEITEADRMAPFLMTMASDSDHWLYISSNGGMTAGRVNPDQALLPYYTQDKLEEMAESSGSRTMIRVLDRRGEAESFWDPFTKGSEWNAEVTRTIRKNIYGNHIEMEEFHAGLQLRYTVSWRPSGRFGIVRKVRFENTGEQPLRLQVLDGLQNVLPPGFNQRFLNEFSNLGQAYKQAELDVRDKMALYHLSSIPTDLAEPKEALLATSIWQVGLNDAVHLLSDIQIKAFRQSGIVTEETYVRARRGAYLMARELQIPAGESCEWHMCADVGLDAKKVEELKMILRGGSDLTELVEKDCRETEQRLSRMLFNADGLQCTADARKCMRHTSNVLFNLMRGGTFPSGYELPKEDLRSTIGHFNKQALVDFEELLEKKGQLTCIDPWDSGNGPISSNPDLRRLLREYLPLSFSRRHGDPSRPWNKFSIEIRNPDGTPRYYYQGNWRDIFQNWEALVHSYPEYCEATVCRFLNATTADGYNPYRLTKDGYDWEVIDPNDNWANIGYWGDHQIIYLLKLLETSVKFHPERLATLLDENAFVYAEVPYRIRSYQKILEDPRATVDYDEQWEKRIQDRENKIGADGKLAHSPDMELIRVTLMEKLLAPLVAKLSNYIPGGGIWMNTQRPEWNDANNALVGYGVSVITLAYICRYIKFLTGTFRQTVANGSFHISTELADLIKSQHIVFSRNPDTSDPVVRKEFMDGLGIPASQFRDTLYNKGLSAEKIEMDGEQILDYLGSALKHVESSLASNRRDDSLWHSYNLVRYDARKAEIHRLKTMLEGQVAVLSAGILDPRQSIELLDGLRASPLYRKDQNSYILYPDRELPNFLDKNRINKEQLGRFPGLVSFVEVGTQDILVKLPSGDYAFNGGFHNEIDLKKALLKTNLPRGTREEFQKLFEETFNHHAFTGRSGTFFAYEGLGSIYWHMVSKLALAVQENFLLTTDSDLTELKSKLLQLYHDINEGLGIHKSPAVYGAFPTDAYSHTPAHAGAQQPGMTGQVKEDILLRLTELGVLIKQGQVRFSPHMIDRDEFLQQASSCLLPDSGNGDKTMEIPENSLAFCFCGIPIIYHKSATDEAVVVYWKNDSAKQQDSLVLDEYTSRELFRRTGNIDRIEVSFKMI